MRDKLFGRRTPQPVELPAILQPEDPVNYNSVVDWLLGLSEKDYQTFLQIVQEWRKTQDVERKLLKVKFVPTTQLIVPEPTDQEVDDQLDGLLALDSEDLKATLKDEKADTKNA